jgi:PAS domain S-box-containing protein
MGKMTSTKPSSALSEQIKNNWDRTRKWAQILLAQLKTRLILLVLLAMLPVFGLALFNAARMAELGRNDAREDLLRLARLTAANHEQQLEGARQLLIVLSQSPQVRDGDQALCSQFLANLIPHYPAYALLAVSDLNGDIYCSSHPLDKAVNISEQASFKQAVSFARFSVGEYDTARASDMPSFGLAFPVHDAGDYVKAIVLIDFNLSAMDSLIEKSNLLSYPHTSVFILDKRGVILSSLPVEVLPKGRLIEKEEAFVLLQQQSKDKLQQGSFTAGCLNSAQTCLYSFRSLMTAQEAGYILVSMPESNAYAAVKEATSYQMGGLLFVSVLALASAWFGATFFTGKIRLLTSVTQKIAAGNLSARTGLQPKHDDLYQLAAAFDQMAESLEQRDLALRSAELARSTSEIRLANILQNASEAIVTINENLRVIVFNKGAEIIFGCSREEVLGKTISILLPTPPVKAHKQFLENIKALVKNQDKPKQRYELTWKAKDGRIFPAEVSVSRLKENGFTFITIFLADITLRQQALIDLAESRRELTNLLGSLPGMVYRAKKINDSWSLEFASEGAQELTGYPPDMFMKENGDFYFSLIQPDDLARVVREIDQSLNTGLPYRTMYRIRRAGGLERWVWEQGRQTILSATKETVMEGFITDITEWRKAEEKVEKQYQQLAALRAVDMAIIGLLDLQTVLATLVEQLIVQLQVDAAAILLYQPERQSLEYAAGMGFRGPEVQNIKLRIGEGVIGEAALLRRNIFCADTNRFCDDESSRHFSQLTGEDFTGHAVIPLVAKGELKGMLLLLQRAPMKINTEWMKFLEALVDQAAIAVENAGLYEATKKANQELSQAYAETIEGLANALELRDHETEGHARRVTHICLELSRRMGVPDEELVHIKRGAILHDIGKIGIPDEVLRKPGPLSEEEWEKMRKHPTYAYRLLATIPFLRPALDIPYYHHERWNGSGYPFGLKGEEIPLPARIFSAVDVWDALRSKRHYRPALPDDEVLQYLSDQAGREFDPQVVEIFLEMLTEGKINY